MRILIALFVSSFCMSTTAFTGEVNGQLDDYDLAVATGKAKLPYWICTCVTKTDSGKFLESKEYKYWKKGHNNDAHAALKDCQNDHEDGHQTNCTLNVVN